MQFIVELQISKVNFALKNIFNPYQYGLYSNLIGMGGGRHVFFNFDFFITFETCYNKNLVAEWLGQSTFDLKDTIISSKATAIRFCKNNWSTADNVDTNKSCNLHLQCSSKLLKGSKPRLSNLILAL